MSKNEYPSICSRQMEAIMSITIFFFLNSLVLEISAISFRYSPNLGWGILSHVTRLGSRARSKIFDGL